MLFPSVGIQATLDFNDSVPNKRPVLCTVSHIYFFFVISIDIVSATCYMNFWVTPSIRASVLYSDVIMSAMLSHITSVSIVPSTVCSTADQGKYRSSPSLAFVRGIHYEQLSTCFPYEINISLLWFSINRFNIITSSAWRWRYNMVLSRVIIENTVVCRGHITYHLKKV